MPEVVESFEFRQVGQRTGISYPWDKLLDGGIYKCKEGDDYKGKRNTFLTLARKEASKRGLRLRTGNVEGGCVIQAQPRENAGPTEHDATVNGTAPAPAGVPVVAPTVGDAIPKHTPAPAPVAKGGPTPKPKK